MEIVNVIEGGLEVGGLIAVSIAFLLCLVILIASIYAVSKREEGGLIGTFFGLTLTVFVGWGIYSLVTNPTPDKYEVIITDFNEVYEQGYEIVDQRGDIYVVKKTEEVD